MVSHHLFASSASIGISDYRPPQFDTGSRSVSDFLGPLKFIFLIHTNPDNSGGADVNIFHHGSVILIPGISKLSRTLKRAEPYPCRANVAVLTLLI